MFYLQNLDENDIRKYAQALFVDCQTNCRSFEQVAHMIVTELYQNFQTPQGDPSFALVRVFRASRYQELLPELQDLASVDANYYLTLMASMGIEENWCDRRSSKTRQIIPVNHNMSPMFQGIFQALGLNWDDAADDMPEAINDVNMPIVKYFYVPEASETNYITDQSRFVGPYGIRSVISLGSQFGSGAAYTIICFSREYINQANVRKFAQLTAYISTVLAVFDNRGALWW